METEISRSRRRSEPKKNAGARTHPVARQRAPAPAKYSQRSIQNEQGPQKNDVGLIAILVMSAVSSASAFALTPGWDVKGAELKAGETKNIAETANVTKAFVLETKKSKLAVKCEKLKVNGGKLIGSEQTVTGTNEATSLEFSGCKVTSNEANCEVGTITTVAVLSTLEQPVVGTINIKFAPKTGEEFVTITIKSKTGKTCAQAGKYKVKGFVKANAPEGEVEKLEHKLSFTEASGSSVKFGDEEANFTGEAGLKLNPEEMFSAD